ncbi:unnamed protein product, partial [Rotaria sp. Silwood2]
MLYSLTYSLEQTNALLSVTTAWLFNKLWINQKLCTSSQSMQGKTVLITGGNSGIGYETAKDLLRRGARVIIACRNMDKGRQAVQKLYSETKCQENNLRLMKCDLCSFESIRKFANLYNNEEERLDVLMCNAGLSWSPYFITKDGFNSVMQANYLGHFLLTNLLRDTLRQSRPSRIVNVSSRAHRTEGINTFSLCPGWVWTSFQSPMREAIGLYKFLVLYPIICLCRSVFTKTPEIGAQTVIYGAVEPSIQRSTDIFF